MIVIDGLSALVAASGPLWLVAFGLSFLASACEAASPRDPERSPAPLEAMAGILSLVTPFLLLIHAYLAVTMKQHAIVNPSEALMSAVQNVDAIILAGIAALMVFMIAAPLLPGFLIRKAAPGLGAMLRRASPYLHIIAFAVAVFATRESVFAALISVLRGTPLPGA